MHPQLPLPPDSGDVTKLLRHLGADGVQISEELIDRVYRDLKQLAAYQLKAERRDHTLQPTALVNEAYLRMQGHGQWSNREHFFRVASKVMRQILVDYARARNAKKRGGDNLIMQFSDDSPEPVGYLGSSADELIALDQALSELARKDPRQAQIVELRFFGGLSEQEVCSILGIGARTARRDWDCAKALLYGQLKRRKDAARKKKVDKAPGKDKAGE